MTGAIKIIGTCLVLLCASDAALAQNAHLRPAPRIAARGETFDASMARIAVKAALRPAEQPTQQELLGMIVLMSLRAPQSRSGT